MEVPSVDKVERNLLALYEKMVGPGVWPRTHVIERDAFLLIIQTCVFEFWYPTGEGDWATRWDWKKKTWVDEEETGKVREMREEDEEALIRGKVREQLEKAAGMTALQAKYSPEAQEKFHETLQYVKWFCTVEQVKEKERLYDYEFLKGDVHRDMKMVTDIKAEPIQTLLGQMKNVYA
jgi:hypothetical protein